MFRLATLTLGAAIVAFLPATHALCSNPAAIGVVYGAQAQNTGGVGQLTLYSGSIVTNDCTIISSNGQTQNSNQWCNGDYDNGYSVDCQGGSSPAVVTDGNGVTYDCNEDADDSCDLVGFNVGPCCNPRQ
ncbi:hypothetical protein GE09DRAFT_1060296 [Coniochaeta sp. 2T2.1]|nr:hypothetical protein GE09DRAFT_1060296 [Coniochaeta sp. 2T2.1]